MSIKCPSCGAKVSAEENFCPECGNPVNRVQNTGTVCPSCGSKVSSEENFCPECGAPIAPVTQSPQPVTQSPQSVTQPPPQPVASPSPTPQGSNPAVTGKKSGRSYIAYGIGALVLVGIIGFGITMFTGSNKQPAPSKETTVATQQPEDNSKKQIAEKPAPEKPKTQIELAASVLNDLGITGPVVGTTYGANPDGFYALVGKYHVLVDLKNKQAARIENPEVFKQLIDARHGGREGIISPNFLIIKDKPGEDKDLGAWQASNHFIPLYVPITFDAKGNVKAEKIFSGAGVSPSHYHSEVKEKKNIDLVNLFLKETFPYLDTVGQAMPQEVAAPSAPPVTKSAIASASHSSALKEGAYVYSGLLTVDGDTKTCWAEGVSGFGIGESITYYFNGNYLVSGMTIWTGHQKSEDLFYKNARPVAIRIIGSDGSSSTCQLNDTMGVQRVAFKSPVTVNSIKLVIEKVVPGNKYDDSCIAEVNFF